MKFIELVVMKNDMDNVLDYLGRKAAIQFPEKEGTFDNPEISNIRNIITRLGDAGEYIGVNLHEAKNEETLSSGGDNQFSGFQGVDFQTRRQKNETLVESLCSEIERLKDRQNKTEYEKSRVREAINEARAFSKMNMPFSDFEHLSFLCLRFGRLDSKGISELNESLKNRAVIIPLDENRILAASSKKGRFALDSQLKKVSFEPIAVPDNYRGIPAQMMTSMNEQYEKLGQELENINAEKEKARSNYAPDLKKLAYEWNIALVIEEIKLRFTATESMYHFSGWIVADRQAEIIRELSKLTGGRIAVHSYSPNEIPSVKSGKEKVPVAMKHNAFVKGFEGIVFSYGAPVYGTIDPTAIVAFFFTLMFGIMFGDAGQGFLLFFSGFLIKWFPKRLSKFKKYSTPLVSVGIASMIMGLLAGSVFTNEHLLVAPTRAVTAAVTGYPMDRILHILPMASEGGSITKLLYFFAFTVAIGVIINSLGLIINIFNRCVFRKFQAAFFSKTGLAGLVFFWYALFIAIRIILGGRFEAYDFAGLLVPVVCIFFGPVIWRLIAGEKPVLENGLLSFVMEGFVEVLDTVSTYFSNTVSFLRVGAFALAHAVFSFIVFYFTAQLASSGITGTLSAALIMIAGNAIIIVLEGLIVAIQVIRLQYYEFFNKFFIETGVEFAPFSFKDKSASL
ncbi:MAG: V-type ATP synthase subunit I [Treponema sp.]|nr:V-type ATP synthase subunit I [Treponema sp.]